MTTYQGAAGAVARKIEGLEKQVESCLDKAATCKSTALADHLLNNAVLFEAKVIELKKEWDM